MKIDLRIPEHDQPIIKDYLRLTEQRLVGLISASYVVGSIALGEFSEYFSDIDFFTILSRRASPIDLGHLRKIHQSIEKMYPRIPFVDTTSGTLPFIVSWDVLITEMKENWNPLIQEAINIRQGQKGSLYGSRFGRMVQTVRFLNYVIDIDNGQFVS